MHRVGGLTTSTLEQLTDNLESNMADIRALLAAERQSRRISHPHLSYTKSGLLTCTVCHLNVKSEALWEGHLRSANHRKNAQASLENANKSLKRKIEDVDTAQRDDEVLEEEGRKKTKSRPESVAEVPVATPSKAQAMDDAVEDTMDRAEPPQAAPVASAIVEGAVDEDEWAAFEKDVAPLARPDYSTATIVAAPVSAADLAAQAETERRQRPETEAQDEREDEERRLEEEFDVLEEMEERVRQLRQKREALRNASKVEADTGQATEVPVPPEINPASKEPQHEMEEEVDDDEEEDEGDDWYS